MNVKKKLQTKKQTPLMKLNDLDVLTLQYKTVLSLQETQHEKWRSKNTSLSHDITGSL